MQFRHGISGIAQNRNLTEFRSISESFELIPIQEFRTDINFYPHPHLCYIWAIPELDGIPFDSGIAHPSCSSSYDSWILGCNSVTEFRESLRPGIGWNSVRFRNRSNWFQFRNSALTLIFILTLTFAICEQFRNWTELLGIPWNSVRCRNHSELCGIVGMDSGIAGNW